MSQLNRLAGIPPAAYHIAIGDTMDTDIRGALELGFQAVLVLTGSTRREDLPRYPYSPTLVVESIEDLDREVSPLPDLAAA